MNAVEVSSMIEKLQDRFFGCEVCEYNSNQRNEVKRYLLSKHQQLDIECPNCHKIYKNKNTFDRHRCSKSEH